MFSFVWAVETWLRQTVKMNILYFNILQTKQMHWQEWSAACLLNIIMLIWQKKMDLLHVHAFNLLRYAVLPEVYEGNLVSDKSLE